MKPKLRLMYQKRIVIAFGVIVLAVFGYLYYVYLNLPQYTALSGTYICPSCKNSKVAGGGWYLRTDENVYYELSFAAASRLDILATISNGDRVTVEGPMTRLNSLQSRKFGGTFLAVTIHKEVN